MSNSQVLFATSNPEKFNRVKSHLAEFNITVEQQSLDLPEIQTFDGRQIALEKAAQAFEILKKPVIASDDSWSISALNGFPGPYMKQANHYFKPNNWLDLMKNQTDKKVVLTAHVAIADQAGVDVFSFDREMEFLTESSGHHDTSQILTVVRRLNSQNSVAVDLENGEYFLESEKELWRGLAERIKNHG